MDTDDDDVELTLDLEPEPDPVPDAPVPEAAGDPAAEAFARLEGELALMRRAVQHLAAERADIVIPDYGATLHRHGQANGRDQREPEGHGAPSRIADDP